MKLNKAQIRAAVPMHVYEVRCAKTNAASINFRCAAFGRRWYGEPNAVANAIGYAMHSSRSHDAVIRVYDDAENVIEKHEHKGDFKGW